MQEVFTFESADLFHNLCGIQDRQISSLEAMLGVELIPRGQSFLIRSEARIRIQSAVRFFERLTEFHAHHSIDSFDMQYLHRLFQQLDEDQTVMNFDPDLKSSDNLDAEKFLKQDKIFTTYRGRPLHSKTLNQTKYIESLVKNAVTIATGPAGTGKTFLAVVIACQRLLSGDIEKIILTRPAVEAGESLGFLPGDMVQKVDPYLRPIYDALYECLGMEKVTTLIQAGRIEIAPLAFMRGRTLNDAFIVLDEAQNCTLAQLKMFLTRIGRNSRMAVSGDITQIDLKPGSSGLVRLIHILKSTEGVQIHRFGNEDIIRNPIVERILRAFEKHEAEDKAAT
ncbi:MAG: PhoH family protein [Leptonema sp. (in: Bacteria)]|nr:PhoH family protein [Leptonema sp. (in: bacteria)]